MEEPKNIMLNFFNKVISLSFYAIFFFVPLTFTGDTSELFEFNKMWLTFGLAIVIAVAWLSKMMITKEIRIQRTVLDIPVGLFLLSQIIATIFSLDQHVSFWGYYSRFNGGLLSMITYIFLYYALVSNVALKQVIRYLYASIAAGIATSLWGLPSHFGYDPTCLVFRGTFDVSCWTDAFQPKVRIFSTLGQPDWLAAYLVMLTPISFAFGAFFAKKKQTLLSIFFFAATFLFYLDNLYTRARSGFIGMVVALGLLLGWYIWSERKALRKNTLTQNIIAHKFSVITLGLILVTTFFIGTSITQLDRFSFSGIQQFFASKQVTQPTKPTAPAPQAAPTEFGGTDSGQIRLYVWEGALKIWKDHPIFGTGVETFAYAYYLYRPIGHNMTSEWDYLYNKAHNEYLNYLATTGLFGLGTYLAIIILFLFFAIKKFLHNKELDPLSQLMIPALISAYISILVTNFFGFSVVTQNIYLFLIPGFVFFLLAILPNEKLLIISPKAPSSGEVSGFAWLGIAIVSIIGAYLILVLIQYRSADISYALGQNLDHAGQYQQAYGPLHQAYQQRPDEPVFMDELTLNDAVLASALASQNDTADANKLAQEAVSVSNTLITNHPNSVVYWKTRVRVMYILSQNNPHYLQLALEAIQKAKALAPTDAKITYNLALLQAQTNHADQAINTLQETIKLKPDYQDAYFALGTYYREKAVNGRSTVVDPTMEQKAVAIMHYILTHFDPNSKRAKDSLSSWGEK